MTNFGAVCRNKHRFLDVEILRLVRLTLFRNKNKQNNLRELFIQAHLQYKSCKKYLTYGNRRCLDFQWFPEFEKKLFFFFFFFFLGGGGTIFYILIPGSLLSNVSLVDLLGNSTSQRCTALNQSRLSLRSVGLCRFCCEIFTPNFVGLCARSKDTLGTRISSNHSTAV